VFSKLKIPHEAADTGSREPFTPEELRSIARSCERADDDLRHLVAIILDTGARLSEIVGLRREDVKLTGPVPHLWICEDLSWCHRGGRQLLSQRRGKILPFYRRLRRLSRTRNKKLVPGIRLRPDKQKEANPLVSGGLNQFRRGYIEVGENDCLPAEEDDFLL